MSIWASWPTIGQREDDTPDPDCPVLTYWSGFSNHYPAVGAEWPGGVGMDSIPAHCTPGADEYADGQDPSWLRLNLLTTAGQAYGVKRGTPDPQGPMIWEGGEVVLSRAAVIALRDQLGEWLALDHLEDE